VPDYWCNHDEAAAVHGICECGTPVAGAWAVFTHTSIHVLNFDQHTAKRIPGAPEGDWELADLRRDLETVALYNAQIRIGQPAVLFLDLRGDGIPTMRITTPVQQIVLLPAIKAETGDPSDTDSTSPPPDGYAT
jgi:hypothetical protein